MMRKILPVLIILGLLAIACALPRKAPAPATPLPNLPTVASEQAVLVVPSPLVSSPTNLPTEPPPSPNVPPPTPMPTFTPTFEPTLAPTPTMQPTEEPAVSVEPGGIIFEDDFSTDKAVWPQDTDLGNDISTTILKDGILDVNLIEEMYDLLIPLDYYVEDEVEIEVDALLTIGDSSAAFGIMCAHEDVDNYYGMTIAEDGYAEIYKWDNAERSTLWDQENSPAARLGLNHLKAICEFDKLTFFANGQLVATYQSDIPLVGRVGLLAGTLDVGNVFLEYDNFVLRKLDESSLAVLPTEAPLEPAATELPAGVLYTDDFSSDNLLWSIGEGNISSEEISGGLLKTTIHETYYDIYIPLDMPFDGALQIDVDGLSLVGHKNTAYGVMCGFQEGGDYFGMTVTELGHASIYRWAKDVRTPLWDLYDVSAIQRGGNHITGVCNGKVLEFYVNGKLLKTITNYNPIEGGVGVVVSSFGSDEVTLGFDNFTVTSLE